MGKPAIRLSAVPMLHIRRNDHCGTFRHADGGLALFLVPAFSGSTHQDLATAAPGVVDMPVIPTSGFKGHIGDPQLRLIKLGNGLQE